MLVVFGGQGEESKVSLTTASNDEGCVEDGNVLALGFERLA